MSYLDVLLVVAILTVAAWRIVARSFSRTGFGAALIAIAVLAIVQIVIEGVYWQFAPGYLVIATLGLLALFSKRPSKGLIGVAGSVGLAGLALIALAPWMMVYPVPRLTKPDGPYAVGTEIFRWVDASRPEQATDAPDDKRNVIVQAWYPAASDARGAHSTYIDGLGHLPASVSLFPRDLMAHYDRIDTHGANNVALSDSEDKWPVVLFTPGYGAPRAFYTVLATGLASRGYVVLAIDHPYESAVTELADGSIATMRETHSDDDPKQIHFMRGRTDLRIEDIRFVIDQLNRTDAMGPRLAGRLDADRIAAIGHSLGGATAAIAMDVDHRIRAAANIDGTLYGDIPGEKIERPFLLLDSDHSETGHSEDNIANNSRLLDHFGPGSYRFEISRANHFDFTDALLFLAPPARFATTLLIGGERGPAETQHATIDILDAFLSGPLKDTPSDIQSAANKYHGISGGRLG
jgi:dienelactone hydrolase